MTARTGWSTSSYGEPAGMTDDDLATLGAHTEQCTAVDGRIVALRCGGARLLQFVAARSVTSVVVVGTVVGTLLMWR
jgi:hypothetical protein